MAYWIDEESLANARGSSRQIDFFMDSKEDVLNLPTHSKDGVPQGDTITHLKVDKGSSALSLGDSSVFYLNSEDNWVEL